MAGKIINTLKYGDRKTKGKLTMMIGVLAVGIVILLIAFGISSMMLGAVAFLILLVDVLVLMNTAFGTKEITVRKQIQNSPPDAMAALDEIPEEVKNPLATYDEVKLRKAMHAYKVKREHVLIMIDYCQSEQVSQCPAYAWKDYNYVYFLLLHLSH